jgi:hypothetical protein
MTQPAGVPTAGFLPGRLNIVLPGPGMPWTLRLEWDDNTGAAINFAGYSARFEWKDAPARSVAPPAPTVALTSGSPNMVLTLTDTQTAGIAFRALSYTLYVTEPSGDEQPWLEGVATIGGTGR